MVSMPRNNYGAAFIDRIFIASVTLQSPFYVALYVFLLYKDCL